MNVLSHAKQPILVSRESVTSFTGATFIKSEKAEHLLEGIIVLTSALHPSDGPPAVIRADPAPGFQNLALTQPLKDRGITFELGHTKNPNKNPVADKAIQELEDELVRIEPSENPITLSQLTLAVSSLNSRIRLHGLSAYELMFRRNQYTATDLDNKAKDIIDAQHNARLDSHPASLKAQRPRRSAKLSLTSSKFTEGCTIYLKNERSKHKARERYLVMSREGDWLIIRKLTQNNLLRGKEYKVHASECFTTVASPMGPASKALETSSEDFSDPVVKPGDPAPLDTQPSEDGDVISHPPPIPAIQEEDLTLDESHSQPDTTAVEPAEPTPVTLPRRNPARKRRPPTFYGVGFDNEGEEEEEERATSGL